MSNPTVEPLLLSDRLTSDRVARLLKASSEEIAQRWLAAITRQATERGQLLLPPRKQMANLRALVEVSGPALSSEPSTAQTPALDRARLEAVHLGQLRQTQGFTLIEVIQDYAALRREALRFLQETLAESAETLSRDELEQLHALFDYLLTVTVETYYTAEKSDLEELVARDSLTGIFNHGYFWERLEQELARARRHQRSLAVLMIDIDHFKEFNDRHGHLYGDLALREISQVLQTRQRRSDTICRYGGEEFAMILPEANLTASGLIAERIRQALADHPFRGSKSGPEVLTASIGCASCADGHLPAKELVAMADLAMYQAKHRGRNRVHAYVIDEAINGLEAVG